MFSSRNFMISGHMFKCNPFPVGFCVLFSHVVITFMKIILSPLKTKHQKDICTLMWVFFFLALFALFKCEKREMSVNEWTDKDVVDIYNGTVLSHRNKFCHRWQHGRLGGHFSEWNKSDRERLNNVWFHLCVELEKKKNM